LIEMVALGTAAPDSSITMPDRLAPATWALAGNENNKPNVTANRGISDAADFRDLWARRLTGITEVCGSVFGAMQAFGRKVSLLGIKRFLDLTRLTIAPPLVPY